MNGAAALTTLDLKQPLPAHIEKSITDLDGMTVDQLKARAAQLIVTVHTYDCMLNKDTDGPARASAVKAIARWYRHFFHE